MRLTLIAAALGLSACTTTPTMESALAPLIGQPVQFVVEQLGPPSSITPNGAETIYEWHRTSIVRGANMSSSHWVGGAVPSESGGTLGGTSGVAVPRACQIRILTDAEGRIKDSQFGEQTGGCRESAKKLSQFAFADAR